MLAVLGYRRPIPCAVLDDAEPMFADSIYPPLKSGIIRRCECDQMCCAAGNSEVISRMAKSQDEIVPDYCEDGVRDWVVDTALCTGWRYPICYFLCIVANIWCAG